MTGLNNNDDRDSLLLEELRCAGYLSISGIQKKFNVSPSTARRMCLKLEEKGHAIRGIGGVHYAPDKSASLPENLYRQFSSSNMAEKDAVALYAVTLVRNGDILFVSSGTTTALFSRRLAERLRMKELRRVVVATNSLENADILGAEAEVIITGGRYRSPRRDMVGIICEKTLQESRFDKAFTGVDSIDIENGLMTFDIDTAHTDQIVLNNSAHTFILTDHTKFERAAYISYARIDEKCTVLTDAGINPDLAEQAARSGVHLITV
jgi:DeoR/GlpR family transcriptional regulator of sugar metabolism